MTLAVVRDLRDVRALAGPDELEAFETDVLAGFTLARAAAGLSDGTVSSDVIHLEQVRAWFGRPLWEMEPPDADEYFGKALRATARGTRLSRAQALKTYFLFLELRHKVEIHQMTGRVVECPIEACKLDLADVKWDLGLFGKLHVRHGKGARGSGHRERMVPLINNAGATLRWFVEDVWAQFGDDYARPAVPLLPSERKNADGSPARVGDAALRAALKEAARTHLPDWPDVVTPHVLRHFCASGLYLAGMDLIAIQATLGHAWIATTMNYVHVPGTHVEDAWIAGQQRAAERLKGLRK